MLECHEMVEKSKLIALVAMIGVLIFFVWGFLDSLGRSWLIFIVVGIAILAISMFVKDENKG